MRVYILVWLLHCFLSSALVLRPQAFVVGNENCPQLEYPCDYCPLADELGKQPKFQLIWNSVGKEDLPRQYRHISMIGNNGHHLRISGSAQPSYNQIKLLYDLSPKDLVIVDLREEVYAILNDDVPISWYCPQNWGFSTKSSDEINSLEYVRVRELSTLSQVMIYDPKNSDFLGPVLTKVLKANTEEEILKNYFPNALYVKIRVADHSRPSDFAVEQFLEKVYRRYHGKHLHFHCKGGKGRTTTFMILTDILKSAHKSTLDNIFLKHLLIGGSDLKNINKDAGTYQHPLAIERYNFIVEFYNSVRNFVLEGNNAVDFSWVNRKK